TSAEVFGPFLKWRATARRGFSKRLTSRKHSGYKETCMSPTLARRSPVARAFTLIELIVVIVVLAILAGVAIPKYIDYTSNAKASATRGVLGGVRSAIANFYANSALT